MAWKLSSLKIANLEVKPSMEISHCGIAMIISLGPASRLVGKLLEMNISAHSNDFKMYMLDKETKPTSP